MKKVRLIELFAGYGSQAMAIKRLGIPFESYRVVEFDKYAINSYNAVHGTSFPTIDIRDFKGEDLGVVDTDKYNYVMTYSFPCTDLSVAGKMQGMSRDSGTRSGLLWQVERILREAAHNQKLSLPQFLIMENVPQVHGENNIKDFGEWITFLDSLGYISKWSDLNAKDYGIPQNRERCFMVSYLDKSLRFRFPDPIKLEKTARDYLEDNVDDKYYIKSEKAQELIKKLILDNEDPDTVEIKANTESGFFEMDNGGLADLTYPESETRHGRVQTRPRVCPTLTANGEINTIKKEIAAVERSTAQPEINTVVNCIKAGSRGITNFRKDENGVIEELVKVGDLPVKHEVSGRVYSTAGISPTITTVIDAIPKFLTDGNESANSRGYLNYKRIESPREDIAKTLCSRDSKGLGGSKQTQNGVIETELVKVGELDGYESRSRVYSAGGLISTIQTSANFNCPIFYNYRIRRLTPLECYRLMDVSDEDALKMLSVNSETQCYKQAGNSIVVSVLMAIFKNLLLGGSDNTSGQLDIYDLM